jgi:hypothetical protein
MNGDAIRAVLSYRAPHHLAARSACENDGRDAGSGSAATATASSSRRVERDQHRAPARLTREGDASPRHPAVKQPLATGRRSLSPRRPSHRFVLDVANSKPGSDEAFAGQPETASETKSADNGAGRVRRAVGATSLPCPAIIRAPALFSPRFATSTAGLALPSFDGSGAPAARLRGVRPDAATERERRRRLADVPRGCRRRRHSLRGVFRAWMWYWIWYRPERISDHLSAPETAWLTGAHLSAPRLERLLTGGLLVRVQPGEFSGKRPRGNRMVTRDRRDT